MAVVERASPAMFIGAEPIGRPGLAPEPWFLDPRELLRTLRARWWAVLLPVVVLGGLVMVWLSLASSQFAASTQILIDPRGLQVVKDGVNPQDPANDASLILVDSQIRVLTSDDVLRRVVETLQLDRDPDFDGSGSLLAPLRAAVSAMIGQAGLETDPKLTALRALRDRTGARRLERSFVVELGVTTSNRDKSARLARAIAETYLVVEAEARTDTTRRAGAAVQGRLGELQEALRGAEDRAQAYRAERGLVGTRSQLVSEQQLSQLSDQLGAARARVAEQRSRLDQTEALMRGPFNVNAITEVVQSATIGQLRAQLAQLQTLQADTDSNLGPRHPMMRTIETQVRSLRTQIEAEIRRIAAAGRNEYRAALANEASLAATLERRKREALTTGENFVRLRELERQVEASRAVYEAFLVRARELQQQQGFDTSTSRIISPASPPAKRLGPPTPVVLAAALISGLGLGVVFALVADGVAGRVRSGRRLEQVTGLPVIASLPLGRPPLDVAARNWGADRAYGMGVARLRSRVRGDRVGGAPLTVAVTSADEPSGRSMLALGLAFSAALDGERVLLVDADPEGLLTRDLGLPFKRGLGDVLERGESMHDAFARGPAGISFLAGSGQPLQAEALAAMLRAKDKAFDFVVIDAGLIGADVAPERLIHDSRVSAVLLTASASHSRLKPIKRALNAIGRDPRLRLVVTGDDQAV